MQARMTEGIRTIIYPVKDIAQAKKLYSKLLGMSLILMRLFMLALGLETKK